MSLSRKAAICGLGQTEMSRESGRSVLALACEAADLALADAGLRPADVDAVMCYAEGDSVHPHVMSSAMGIPLNYHADIYGGGSTVELAVGTAAALIDGGMADTVLIYRALNGRSGTRLGVADILKIPHWEFMGAYGFTNAIQMFSFMARRHMHEFGTTREHLGAVATTFREHANRNPAAMMHGRPMSMDDYLAARMISEPYGLFDCCLESDGASAIIVTSLDRARDCRTRPVVIAGAAGRTSKNNFNHYVADDMTDVVSSVVADRIYAMAGLGPGDVDVAAVYDCVTYVVLAQLEGFGFAKRGEGGPWIADGALRLDGSLPTNTAGGMLSEGMLHGMNNLVELARQLRNDYEGTDRQVAGAEIGLCAGWETTACASGLILECDR